jgi:uncharacterized protein YraI
MFQRSIYAASALSAALLWSAAADAAPGNVTDSVNMRTGPSTQYPVITTITAGAPVEVFECESWCRVGFAGTYGYVSANYISGGFTEPAPRPYYQSRAYYQPEPLYEPDIGPTVQIYSGRPWYVAPSNWHRWHYRRGDGTYFEFGN